MLRTAIGCLLLIIVGCAPKSVRFATFNASLNRDAQGQLLKDMERGDDQQIRNVAEVIQRVRPDVLLINEFDYDESGRSIELFRRNYLNVPQNGAKAIEYKYSYTAPVNTGVSSGHDLDNNGKIVTEPGSREYGGDCFGFGLFPGQYGMVVLSRYPIDTNTLKSYRLFKWKDFNNPMLPTKADGSPWYDEAELEDFRLPSKSLWDIPVKIGGKQVRLICSHPTPPAFDGPEDRNGKRNYDEIRLLARRVIRPEKSANASRFVTLGDLNADPKDGGSVPGAIHQLLDHSLVNASLIPSSTGAAEASDIQGEKNKQHQSPAYQDTADFPDTGPNGPGNLRCDYVLPSKFGMEVLSAGVFWPTKDDPLHRLVEMEPKAATSDHRLVWVDLRIK